MPAAIPMIAAYAATSTAVAAGWVVAGGIGAALIGAGAAALAGSLMPRPKQLDIGAGLSQPGGGRTLQFRQPTPSHEVVIGRIKKSGPIMFVDSRPDNAGRADGYIYMIHALAAHRCKRIGDVYLNDLLSSDARFSGLLRFGKYLGTADQISDPDFVAETEGAWTTDHRLRGRAVLYSRLKGNAAAFPNGLPNVSAIIWGSDEIHDPRTDSTGWTNNAILAVYWWMTRGEGYEASDFDQDALIAAANICDERVRVLGSTTTFSVSGNALTLAAGARSLDVGDGVRVSSTGALPTGLAADTTYYLIPSDDGSIQLALTVQDSFSDTAITLSSTGTGTLTLTYWDEARYKINGTFAADAEKRDVRDQLLTACAGFAVEIGGVWFLHAGAAATPTLTMDEDDLRGPMTTQPKRSMRDRFNGVRSVFVNPDNNWQPGDAIPLSSATYVEEDNDVSLYEDVRFPFTTSARAVQRLMKIHLQRNRKQRTVKFPAKLTGMRLRPLDGVFLSNSRYQWDQEQHIVMGWALAEDGGIDIQLQEDSASVYAWNFETDEQLMSIPQNVNLPDPSVIAPPFSVTVTTPTTISYTQVNASWSEVASIWLSGYDSEYRNTGGTDWTGYGRIGNDVARAISVERTTPQDFQVRAVALSGATSAFTQSLAPAHPASVVATGGSNEITITWTPQSGAVQIFASDEATKSTATLLDTVAGSAGTFQESGLGDGVTRYYWLRSVATDGNYSDEFSANATTDTGGDD